MVLLELLFITGFILKKIDIFLDYERKNESIDA